MSHKIYRWISCVLFCCGCIIPSPITWFIYQYTSGLHYRHWAIIWIMFFRVTPLALGQLYDCPSAREATLKNMGIYCKNNTVIHNQVLTVCIHLVIYSTLKICKIAKSKIRHMEGIIRIVKMQCCVEITWEWKFCCCQYHFYSNPVLAYYGMFEGVQLLIQKTTQEILTPNWSGEKFGSEWYAPAGEVATNIVFFNVWLEKNT